MRLLLIRHGASLHTQRGLISIETCPGLAPDGHRQAGRLAARLARDFEGRGARLLASPVARARQTAEAVAAALRVEIEDDPDLKELIPGEADGLTREAHDARYGAFDPGADPARPFSPGGESWNDFDGRVRGLLARVAADHAGETLLAVTHGGVIVVAMLTLLGMADAAERAFLQPTFTGITEFTCDAGRWRLERYNDASHLDEGVWQRSPR